MVKIRLLLLFTGLFCVTAWARPPHCEGEDCETEAATPRGSSPESRQRAVETRVGGRRVQSTGEGFRPVTTKVPVSEEKMIQPADIPAAIQQEARPQSQTQLPDESAYKNIFSMKGLAAALDHYVKNTENPTRAEFLSLIAKYNGMTRWYEPNSRSAQKGRRLILGFGEVKLSETGDKLLKVNRLLVAINLEPGSNTFEMVQTKGSNDVRQIQGNLGVPGEIDWGDAVKKKAVTKSFAEPAKEINGTRSGESCLACHNQERTNLEPILVKSAGEELLAMPLIDFRPTTINSIAIEGETDNDAIHRFAAQMRARQDVQQMDAESRSILEAVLPPAPAN